MPDNDALKGQHVTPPAFVKKGQWEGYAIRPWHRRDRKTVTLMFNFVERRKSFFFGAFIKRLGIAFRDMGDHVKEDVTYGRLYGNRMECNPMYFTSGSLIRNLLLIEKETGLSREEIAEKYVFLGGGGQCGPCRYGMYPAEYLKVVNEAGFKDFRILIFSSDIGAVSRSKTDALQFNLMFRINMIVAVILADLVHAVECALRARAVDGAAVAPLIARAEQMLRRAFESRFWFWTLPAALKKVGKMCAALPRKDGPVPLIYVTGEFFANLAHNDGNYHLRRFISDEGCEVIPGSFTQRVLYDNWRRSVEATRGIAYASSEKERRAYEKSLKKQKTSTKVIVYLYNRMKNALHPEAFGGRTALMDLDHMAQLAKRHYHPEIFGGEGHLEVAEAIHLAREGEIDGFISCKPFGCMPSSGVSDGVQAKITSMFPELNFLSIETSGDNDVGILSRVSMLLLKAKQRRAARSVGGPGTRTEAVRDMAAAEEPVLEAAKEQYA
jgi:predicted nucleotide-binding protein (sugar kinase/HSP70/actin superfamily)